MISNDRAGYNRGYDDGKRDVRRGDVGYNFSGLPAMYARGYRAGKQDASRVTLTVFGILTVREFPSKWGATMWARQCGLKPDQCQIA